MGHHILTAVKIVIFELLCMKYHYIHLAMLSSDEVDFVTETLHTSYFLFFFSPFVCTHVRCSY